MTKTFTIIILAALTVACLARILTTSRPPQKWEYAVFEWQDMVFDKDTHPNEVLSTFLDIPHENEADTPTLQILLNALGAHGWELVCFDGKSYIVRHPVDGTSPHTFILDRHWSATPQIPDSGTN